MRLLRAMVLWSLQIDLHINAVHEMSGENFTDFISYKRWVKLKSLRPVLALELLAFPLGLSSPLPVK